MDEGPTTMNGPLHTPHVALDDKLMSATFAGRPQAEAAQASLIQAGIDAGMIAIVDQPGTGAPAEQSVLGHLREAVLPEDSEQQRRSAQHGGDVLLEVRPGNSDINAVIRIIQAAGPQKFDADLERWRNKA